jgi:CHAD domain-containing protein
MAKAFKVKKVSARDDSRRAGVRILQTRLREFYSHWTDPEKIPTGEQLHALRISGKRLRYSAESLRELYADKLALLLAFLKQIQDALGEIQDCETHQALLKMELGRLRRKSMPSEKNVAETNAEISALEILIEDYQARQQQHFAAFSLLWRGLLREKIREALKDLITHPELPVDSPPETNHQLADLLTD